MTKTLTNGIGESLGDLVVTCAPLLLDQEVLYVDSTNADAANSAGYGRTKTKPYATLAYAFTQAEAGDIIVLMDGHTESIAIDIDINIPLTIVGSGQASGKPTVKLSLDGPAGASVAMLVVSADNVQLRNIWFQAHKAAATIYTVSVTGDNCLIKDCYFEGNENNNAAIVNGGISAAELLRLNGCTFVSTSETDTDLCPTAVQAASGIWEIDNCVFDDGAYGFTNNAVFVAGPCTIRGFGNTLLNGATFEYYEDASHFVHLNATATDGLGGKIERNN